MQFARIVFHVAAAWGVILLAPLYFLFDRIGIDDPPPITHPGFFYGFVGIALAWQVAFVIIARDPVRFRPIMIPSILEKVAFGVAAMLLYAHGQVKVQDLGFGLADLAFAALFALAYVRVGRAAAV